MERSPPQVLTELIHGHIAARCVQVVAELGVADALGDAPASAAQLAAHTGADADALERILRLLAAHGVFERRPDGIAHTAASRLLRSDHPQSLRPLARMHGLAAIYGAFAELPHAARTGRPGRDWAELVRYFSENPEEARLFDAAMVAKSARVVPAVLEAYDFGPFATIADIGGGRAHLLEAILERAPRARGVLFELPHVIAQLPVASPRIELAAGDFFTDPLPEADAYVLMDVLHDWPDEAAAKILAGIRRAAAPHARLLIVEALIPDSAGAHFAKTLDITMLAVTGGRERTPDEYAELLAAGGFRLKRMIGTGTAYSIVDAAAV